MKYYQKNRQAVLDSAPERRLLAGAKKRAAEKNLPFTLTLQDIVIPEVCPVLGIPLRRARLVATDNSPNLDRLIPALGYVPGNVRVISRLANMIKSNATPQQIRAVADWYEAQLRASSFMS